MRDSVKRLIEVCEVVEPLVFKCFAMMTRLLKIFSTVLRPGLKPAGSSASSFSALALSRLRMTRSMILLGWRIRLMRMKPNSGSV